MKDLDWEYSSELIRASGQLTEILVHYKCEVISLAAAESLDDFRHLTDIDIHKYDMQLKMALSYVDQLREDIFEHARKLRVEHRETENHPQIDSDQHSTKLKQMLNQIKEQPEDKKK